MNKQFTESLIKGKYHYTCSTCKISRTRLSKCSPYWHDCQGSPKLGDKAALLLKKLGIGTCSGCDKRRQWLNKLGAKINGFTNMGLRSDNLRTESKHTSPQNSRESS